MPDPKWVLAMGVCASSGGMFNNYAIVQGVDHVVPVDMYLPGCPPRPEMLIDAILKLHDQVQNRPLGPNMAAQIEQRENDALKALPTSEMKGLHAVSEDQKDVIPEPKGPEQRPSTSRRRTPRPTLEPEPRSRSSAQREGMFGVPGTGDTSGYGGLVQPIVFPGARQRPFEGWHEDVAAALDTALAGGGVEPRPSRAS